MTALFSLALSGRRTIRRSVRNTLQQITICVGLALFVSPALAATPKTGDQAPNFSLSTPLGDSIMLSTEVANGETILIVLRGYPGYQCPYCVKQVHDYVEHASEFAARKAQVLFVYPGPPAALDEHAKEFLTKQADLPSNIKLVIDPDYKMTNLYGLRWDDPNETAYPSTFVLAKRGKITFEKISHGHGDRTTAADVLVELAR